MQETTARDSALATVSGLLTGIAAGFIGVGGGEFRIPVLVQLLRFPLKLAGGVNLVVGLFTVALGVIRRWGQQSLTGDDLLPIGLMGSVSLVLMGVASAVGVIIGAALLPYADRDLIKGALGIVLLLATARLTVGPAH